MGEGAVVNEDLSNVVNEDLSNVVDIGKAIFDNTSYDHYVKTLVDHIGRMIFVDRKYTGGMASLYRDSWEYGAVMEKVYGLKLPNAVENETWELTDGASYEVEFWKWSFIDQVCKDICDIIALSIY